VGEQAHNKAIGKQTLRGQGIRTIIPARRGERFRDAHHARCIW
jgi:hypothetical protein